RDRRLQARTQQQLEAHPSAHLAQNLAARALPPMGFRAADDPLPDLLAAVAQAHVQRQQAALANLAWREAEAQAGAAFAREAESAGWVGRWATLLVEGVQIQGAAKQAIRDTSGGHARANDRAARTGTQKVDGDGPIPQDRTQTPGLGEEGEYISDFNAGGKPDPAVTHALGQAHIPAHRALVSDSWLQVQQVADSLDRQQTANSTLNALNAGAADWLLRDLSGMEGHRRDKEAAERRRNDQLLTCDASARLTLNAYAVMKEKSEETRVKYGTQSFWDNFQ
ncbi:MAG TPA: hypothetical protein PKW90_21090, partial [Myxococcota bacterium]|nr:hypothetical protein [Myxococcota bacterium]